jgi:transposase-like protein
MSFKKIEPEFKLEILRELWGGTNFNQISKKHNIPRSTIYKWEQIAKEAILKAFQDQTPGKRTIDPVEENKILKEQIRIVYHNKHKTAQTVSPCFDTKPPLVICNKCGNTHVKKNGTVITKKDGLCQRYTCVECSFSVYIEIKKTLNQPK